MHIFTDCVDTLCSGSRHVCFRILHFFDINYKIFALLNKT